jgi:hypothetical protein
MLKTNSFQYFRGFAPSREILFKPPGTWGVSRGLEGLQNGLRVFFDHAEEGSRRTIWDAAALFPVLKRGLAHADHQGELTLGYVKSTADSLHIQRIEGPHTARGYLPFSDPTSLGKTFSQICK